MQKHQADITKLHGAKDIERMVEGLARRIDQDYRGREVILVGCLTGAFVFMADLMRRLTIGVECDFIRVSSYEDRMQAGTLRLDSDLVRPVGGRDVIIVEDIVDTGQTLTFIRNHILSKNPASVKTCALLYKRSARSTLTEQDIDYLGCAVPDVFVVGYGIDCAQKHRSLPYIGYLEQS